MGGVAREVQVVRIMRREMGSDRGAVSEHRTIDDFFPVDRVGNRLADANVFQQFRLVVGREDRFAFRRTDDHREPRIGLELCQRFLCREVRERVDIAGHHCGKRRGRIGNELEGGAFKRNRLTPVIRIANDPDLVSLDPFLEGERSGPDRVCRGRFDRFGCNDDGVSPCHLGYEPAVGIAQRHLNGMGIEHRNVGDSGKQRLLGVGRIIGTRAVERELDILGIKRGSVMKGDTLTQAEGVDHSVVRYVPRRGERGTDGTIGLKSRQSLEDVGVHDFVDCRRGASRGIKIGRLELHSDRYRRVFRLGTHDQ